MKINTMRCKKLATTISGKKKIIKSNTIIHQAKKSYQYCQKISLFCETHAYGTQCEFLAPDGVPLQSVHQSTSNVPFFMGITKFSQTSGSISNHSYARVDLGSTISVK